MVKYFLYLSVFISLISAQSLLNYEYYDSTKNFSISIQPKFGLKYKLNGNFSGYDRWWGAGIKANFDSTLFGYLDFRDIGEIGDNKLENKFLTPQTGYWINNRPKKGIEYSDVRGGIKYSWGWGSISLEKNFYKLGSGIYGQLIHSHKASSYPFISLKLNPIDWLEFEYYHGWLTSNVDDSLYFYPTTRIDENGVPIYREKYKDKFIALNLLTIHPFEWWSFSLGNSVIYGNNGIQPEYLIPFLLYKFIDHNMGRDNTHGNNGQIFFDTKFKLFNKSLSPYFTFFLENASITDVAKNDLAKTWFGYTIGTQYNFLAKFQFNIEYTRVNPWVYEHFIQNLSYKHIDYELGHWIGQNADHLMVELTFKPIKKLSTGIYYQSIRKGGLLDQNLAFDATEEKFLYGPLRKDMYLGFDASYSLYDNLIIYMNYYYSEISDEDQNRTQGFLLGKKHNLILGFRLGTQ